MAIKKYVDEAERLLKKAEDELRLTGDEHRSRVELLCRVADRYITLADLK